MSGSLRFLPLLVLVAVVSATASTFVAKPNEIIDQRDELASQTDTEAFENSLNSIKDRLDSLIFFGDIASLSNTSQSAEFTRNFIGDEIETLISEMYTIDLVNSAQQNELLEVYLEAVRARYDILGLKGAENATELTQTTSKVFNKEELTGSLSNNTSRKKFRLIIGKKNAHGWSESLLKELVQYANETNDPEAIHELAYIQIFEPQQKYFSKIIGYQENDTNVISSSVRKIRETDAVGSSVSLLLGLIDVAGGFDTDSTAAQRGAAQSRLISLASDAMVSNPLSLYVAGYQTLRNKGIENNTCEDVVSYLEPLATINAYYLHDRKVDSDGFMEIRLSKEWKGFHSQQTKAASQFAWLFGAQQTSNMTGKKHNSSVSHAVDNEAVNTFEYYRSLAANQNHQWSPFASQYLGETYYFGDANAGIEPNTDVAARYFRQAAQAGHPDAQYSYALLLMHGSGVEQDDYSSVKYMHEAASQGQSDALHSLGKLYLEGYGPLSKNATKAIYYLQMALKYGNKEAHVTLGDLYLYGDDSVEQDLELALKHLTAAAEADTWPSAILVYNVGIMKKLGLGGPYACEEATGYFRRVALQSSGILERYPFSFAKAYENYQNGDYRRAYLNYRLMGELGFKGALMNAAFVLEKFGDQMFENHVFSARVEALNLYQQAADLNDTEAMMIVGQCYEDPVANGWEGICSTDIPNAAKYYKRAALLGHQEAGFKLAWMYAWKDAQSVQNALVSAKALFLYLLLSNAFLMIDVCS